jgi:hypothetical protein
VDRLQPLPGGTGPSRMGAACASTALCAENTLPTHEPDRLQTPQSSKMLGIFTMPIHRQQTDDDEMEWPPDDFTGEWVVEWPNGQVKFRSLYLKGKEEGEWFCYWSNGNVAQQGYNSDGKCVGVWSDYGEDGVRFKETEFYSPDDFDVRWLTVDGQVREIQIFRDGCERETKKLLPDA